MVIWGANKISKIKVQYIMARALIRGCLCNLYSEVAVLMVSYSLALTIFF